MNTAWPGNELEEVLAASLGNDSAGGRLVEVLGRSQLWVPLPNGGGPDSPGLDLPTMEIEGVPYVPVFQLRAAVPPVRRGPYALHRRPGP